MITDNCSCTQLIEERSFTSVEMHVVLCHAARARRFMKFRTGIRLKGGWQGKWQAARLHVLIRGREEGERERERRDDDIGPRRPTLKWRGV